MSDTSRPLALRLRPDLAISRENFGMRQFVVVKDPLALRFFRLQEEEYVLLELLDGTRTLDEMQTILQTKFAPRKFRPEDMSQFIASMHQAGLVQSEARGQGPQLLARRRKSVRREWMQKLLSPLAIRVRGFDPTWMFDFVYPCVRWCFSKTALAFAACLMLAALSLIVVQYEEFHRRLPTFHQFFTPTNMLLLMGVLGAIKVLHEFGHGLTCRHFGGECHELGLMFLVFAPCLYCNVSDAWRLTKRQRIAVSAAGIIVELVIASLAVFLWWFSTPGLLNQLCLGAMFVSGVSTLLINGNPLMRYDGYFILSDLVETPNLAEKSSLVLREAAVRHGLGIVEEPDPMSPQHRRGWFALYAVASCIYRVLITYSIYLFLMEWLKPYNLEIVARVFGLMSVVGFTAMPLWRAYKFFSSAGQRDRMRRGHVIPSAVCCVALVLAFVLVPLPQRVWGTLEIEPRNVARLYVEVPGKVIDVEFAPGTRVAPGTVVARLENLDLELQIAELAGRQSQYLAQLASLRQQRFHDAGAALRIPELEKSLAAVAELLTEKRAELDRLTIKSPRGGIVLPPPEAPKPKETALGELPTWSGLPSHPTNRGAKLEAGTLFCQVGDEHEWQALVVVDQTDIGLLEEGQSVEIRFDELPEITVAGRIDEISRREMSESPRRLSNKSGGELATETDEAGIERPIAPTYQARIVLYDPHALLRIGLRGTARIHVPSASLGSRVARWLSRTFHFQL